MCVHLYEILAYYIFNVMVGSEELSFHYRIDSMNFFFVYVCSLSGIYILFEWRNMLKGHRQEIHDHQLDMQMNIAPGALIESS